MTNALNMYCVTNKKIEHLEHINYKLVWVGSDISSNSYIKCNYADNIFFKEKCYSELTFHYWYWKNLLNLNNQNWVGFCQKRRFWIKSSSKSAEINKSNLKDHLIIEPEDDWKNYDSVICKPINISGAKKIKILKRGWKNILRNPGIFFGTKKETIKIHFDMHHGYGNLDRAISYLEDVDRNDFLNYVNTHSSFNPHIMCISKPVTLNKWFNSLFPWLERCEKEFGLENLEGYDLQRIYAFLAERYHSFWFRKYTKFKEADWIFIDN